MALFASTSASEAENPPFLKKEAQFVAHLNKQAYDWLGPRYRYFHKIRTAKEGFSLFGGVNLEELMEATRSAINLVIKSLNAGLISAHNGLIDQVGNSGVAPENWPVKIEMPDRGNPPNVSDTQDALIINWMPIKFLNLAKMVRDKGKGLDLYSEGIVKKLYFKVIGYYCDPSHWDSERLGYFLTTLAPDAPVLDVNNRLSALKSELDLFASSYQLFKFGRPPRTAIDASTKNTLEDALELTQEEMVQDLYFQQFIVLGLESFLFRYYLTLLGCTTNPRALRSLSAVFEPALAKAVEQRVQFQASFLTEREKIRIRAPFQQFGAEFEAKPGVEEVEEKGHPARHINYSLRLQELTAFTRAAPLPEHAAHIWTSYLKHHAVEKSHAGTGLPLTLEVLNTIVKTAKLEIDAKLKAAQSLRSFADEREKQELRQVSLKKKEVTEAKRKKMTQSRHFKTLEQKDLAETIAKEAEEQEQTGLKEMEAMEQTVAKRKESILARAAQYDEAAQGGNILQAAAQQAGAVYAVAAKLDTEGHFQNELVGYLLQQIQEGEGYAQDLYRQLFVTMPGLYPTQKILLRKALESKIELTPDEMVVTEEEQKSYDEQIVTRKTELNVEAPGVLGMRLQHGPIRATVEELLKLGLTIPSLRLVLQIPLNAPNKPAQRIPPAIAQKIVGLNALMHPFPVMDLVLTNVEESAPPAKRLNFNRLSKALSEGPPQPGTPVPA
jgi:hypothetical protein